MAITHFPQPAVQVPLQPEDKYENAFALGHIDTKPMAKLFFQVLKERDPRIAPPLPKVTTRVVMAALLDTTYSVQARSGTATIQRVDALSVKSACSLFKQSLSQDPAMLAEYAAVYNIPSAGHYAEAALGMSTMRNRQAGKHGLERERLSESTEWLDIVNELEIACDTAPMKALITWATLIRLIDLAEAGYFQMQQEVDNALARKSHPYYMAEITASLAVVMAAAQMSADYVDAVPIYWFLNSPEMKKAVEQELGTLGGQKPMIYDWYEEGLGRLGRIPMPRAVNAILSKIAPAPVETEWGLFTVYQNPGHPDIHDELDKWPNAIRFDPSDALDGPVTWDPVSVYHQFADELKVVSDRIEDYEQPLSEGWQQLGFQAIPSTVGSWPRTQYPDINLHTPIDMSIAIQDYYDAMLTLRLPKGRPSKDFATKRWTTVNIMDTIYRLRNQNLDSPYRSLTLDGDLFAPILPLRRNRPPSEYPRAWEPASYRPLSEWRGEKSADTYIGPCSVAEFANIMSITEDQCEENIRTALQSPNTASAWDRLFKLVPQASGGQDLVEPRYSMMFRTWKTMDPEVKMISLPYVGPKQYLVRSTRRQWLRSGFQARLIFDLNQEPSGNDLLNLASQAGGIPVDAQHSSGATGE